MENPQPHPSRAAVPLHSRSPGPPTPSTSGRCPLSSSLPAIEDGPKKEPHLSRDTRSFSPCLLEKWRPPSRSPFPSPKKPLRLAGPTAPQPLLWHENQAASLPPPHPPSLAARPPEPFTLPPPLQLAPSG